MDDCNRLCAVFRCDQTRGMNYGHVGTMYNEVITSFTEKRLQQQGIIIRKFSFVDAMDVTVMHVHAFQSPIHL